MAVRSLRLRTKLDRILGFVIVSVSAVACTPPNGEVTHVPNVRPVSAGAGTILRVDPRFDELVPTNATIEKLADGFVFIEGPVWLSGESRLLFSDVPGNTIYQWKEAEEVTVFMRPVHEGEIEGSNGLTLDAEGRLVIADHGYRQVSRLAEDGSRTVLADTYEGSRLNSPNDLVFGSDGSLYFTDPWAHRMSTPVQELDFNGIYRLQLSGDLELLFREQPGPKGIALSPDESTLYAAETLEKVWMAFDLDEIGVSRLRVFSDVSDVEAEGVPDGMKVD